MNYVDINGLVNKVLKNLKNLDLLYLNQDIIVKREIISSIFTEKWSFDGT